MKQLNFAVAFLILCCPLNLALAAEPPSEPMLRFDLVEHTAVINRIPSDSNRRYLMTASHKKTALIKLQHCSITQGFNEATLTNAGVKATP